MKDDDVSNLIYIGKILETTKGRSFLGSDAWLDTTFPHVIYITGTRGSGKSFDLGVLVEGISQLSEPASIQNDVKPITSIIVDTQSQFWTLGYAPREAIPANKAQLEELKRWNLKPNSLANARIFAPEGTTKFLGTENTLQLRPRDVRAEEWAAQDASNEHVIEKLVPAVELCNFTKALYQCQGDERFYELVSSKNDYQAMTIFTRIVNLFVHEMIITEDDHRRFKKGAYLFVDELDDLERASVKEAREVNDLLRHIYDSCPNNFCMVIALSAEISQLAVLFFDYVLRRIKRQIELVGLDKDDAVEFVREILGKNRRDPNGEGGYFPFEEAAIDTIASQLTEITPAKIVDTMQQIIEEARLAGHDPAEGPVSADFLDEHEIIEEVLGGGGVA